MKESFWLLPQDRRIATTVLIFILVIDFIRYLLILKGSGSYLALYLKLYGFFKKAKKLGIDLS